MKPKNAVVVGCGWGSVDGSLAAMLVRGLRGDAEAFPVAPENLTDWLEAEGKCFRAIYIINTFFAGDAKRAEMVLKRLKRKGVQIEIAFHKRAQAPAALTVELAAKDLVKYFTKDGGDLDLEDEIKRRFRISTDGLSNIGDLVISDTYCVSNEPAVELIKVGMWHFEMYGRNDIFNEVVHVLADNEGRSRWSKKLLEAVEHYRRFGRRGLIGDSPAMRKLRDDVRRLTQYPNSRVMIFGESGTGKETVAMQLHYGSTRNKHKFVAFNCATVNPELIESRLFGYEKGSFTGAYQQTDGVFEAANGGTLFLDEIGEMSLDVQGILLRTLENGTIQRMGSTEEIPVDVRLITATNRNLVEMVKEGKFRADLYHRLNAIQIRIPPLREHKEDIASIVSAWNAWRQKPNSKYLEPLNIQAIAALESYDYPGNVRELLNILERADVMGETDYAKLIDDYRTMNAGLEDVVSDEFDGVPEDLDGAMRYHVRRLYDKYKKNLTKTAEALKVSRNTVRKYL